MTLTPIELPKGPYYHFSISQVALELLKDKLTDGGTWDEVIRLCCPGKRLEIVHGIRTPLLHHVFLVREW